MTLLDFVIRLIFAFIFGATIGFERQLRQRMAGLQMKVIVEAYLLSTAGRSDHTIEKIIGHICLESGVTAVSWKIMPRDIV